MLWQNRFLVFLALPLLLSACGFEPMHAKNKTNQQLFAGVRIDPIPDREGQILRMRLEDKLNPNGVVPPNPAYRLSANLTKTTGAIGVARDGTVSRYNMYLDSKYTLYRNSDEKAVTSGNIRQVSSYNNLTNGYFSTFVSEQDALKRGVEAISEDYYQRLSLYLSQPDAGEPMKDQPKPIDPNAPQTPAFPTIPAMQNWNSNY
ncbi:MAG: hypothetical protein EBR02_05420 [Alphaproteobacteria bacterium]|nr:hypothetical protein [Alphaproteobacteria bacterium]